MASRHILSLEVPETANEALFRVVDTSTYDVNLPVECAILQIMAPGFNAPKNIDVTPGFNLALNACTLGIQTVNCGEKNQPLPDGVYVIRYSISPNDKAWVEYNHLRTTSTLTAYYKKLSEIDLSPCEPSTETRKIMSEMKYIRSLIDAAKAKVEYCKSPKEGIELLTYAIKKLKSLECNTMC
jgi:hypothetical protein